MTYSPSAEAAQPAPSRRVCMHVRTTARLDERVLREARALVQAGYDVTIVDIERDTERPPREDFEGIHLRHLMQPGRFAKGSLPRKMLSLVRSMRLAARELRAVEADIYHAHDSDALLTLARVARSRRKPLVFDAHELPLGQPPASRSRLLGVVGGAAIRRMARGSSAVITVSPPIARVIHRRYGGPFPVLVRNIPPYQPPIASQRMRDVLGLPPDTRIAIYQGGFQENRSLDVLVRAARYLDPTHRIVLLGGGGAQRRLEALIATEGVGDRVLIHPSVPYRELLEWTASADLGLILYRGSYAPNVQYCLPNKLFEYIMAGVPVLTSTLNAVSEIVQTYRVGRVVDSLEPEPTGRAVSALLADDAARQAMRANALAAAREDLNWEVEQQRLLNIYQGIQEHFTSSHGAHPLPEAHPAYSTATPSSQASQEHIS